MAVELNLEEVSLDQGINCDTLILSLSEAFSGDGQGHLTLLEVEVSRGEDGHYCFGGVSCGVKAAVGGRDIIVEVAFWNTIHIDDWGRNIGSDVDDYFSVGQYVSLGQVIPEEEDNFNWSSLSYW